ncbi:7-deoxyloganetic acid glucosyl transferase [Sesamum angolense]|uniref:7-deoxyloganetic acid glucosyl transferase n=1 Tax=Sesamum angolense TaxID=2727404 RepID=A0AAE1W0E7_9LAMI|nr:7-deoxyloganetic acid glucosyl transferase [Sesamum angolense]
MGTDTELPPHVLIFPLPMQGHINSMLKLAELFCLANLHVTMLLSEYTHGRLLRHANIESRFSRYPGFRVATIPDGLPEDHPRVGERTMEIVMSLLKVGGAEFRKLMETTDALSDGGGRRRVSCLIMDGVLSFAVPVAEEMGIPFIYFRTVGACSFWANFCFKDVIEAGEVPLKGKDEGKYDYWKKEELDLMVTSVPGMEGYLRRRDLPAFCRARLESQKSEESSLPSSSFYEEDRSSISWLDSQPDKSVLYWAQVLVVMRPDSIVGDNKDNPIPAELEEGTKERGYLVGWVPQNEVLAHPSVGAFFTHSGWNSTLEGIAAGMPMICWPYFADQTINSRFVSDVWKVGLDMKDSCDRMIVERMVRDIMEVRRDEFLERALHMAELAKKAISEGGTSHTI